MVLRSRHIRRETLNVKLVQGGIFEFFGDEWMLAELLDWYPIIFVHLQTLDEEEASLDTDKFPLSGELVATIVDFGDQIFHLIAMERCDANHHFIQHDSECPSVYLHTVTSLFEQLRARVEWSSADTQISICAIQNRAKPKIGDFDLEFNASQIYIVQESLFLLLRQTFHFGLVWEMKQDVCKLHVTVDNLQCPDIPDARNDLPDNDSGLLLLDVPLGFQQNSKIHTISVLLHHVDV